MATFEELFQTIRDCDFNKFKELIECNKSLLQYIDNEGNNLLMIFLKYHGITQFIPLDNEGNHGTPILADEVFRTIPNDEADDEDSDEDSDGGVVYTLKNDDYEPNMDIFEYLLQSGIELGHFNNNNQNALMLSLSWYDINIEIIHSLIKSGANVWKTNDTTGLSFYQIIVKSNYADLVDFVYQQSPVIKSASRMAKNLSTQLDEEAKIIDELCDEKTTLEQQKQLMSKLNQSNDEQKASIEELLKD